MAKQKLKIISIPVKEAAKRRFIARIWENKTTGQRCVTIPTRVNWLGPGDYVEIHTV
jgi:hypothetical protein